MSDAPPLQRPAEMPGNPAVLGVSHPPSGTSIERAAPMAAAVGHEAPSSSKKTLLFVALGVAALAVVGTVLAFAL